MQTRPRPRSKQERRAYWFDQALLLAVARPDLYREIRDSNFRGMDYIYVAGRYCYWYWQVVKAIGNPCAYSRDYLVKNIGIYARKLRRKENTDEQQVTDTAP